MSLLIYKLQIESNIRSEYSCISLCEFFVFLQEKVVKICSISILIFRCLILIFFRFSSFASLKRWHLLSNNKSIKIIRNLIDFNF